MAGFRCTSQHHSTSTRTAGSEDRPVAPLAVEPCRASCIASTTPVSSSRTALYRIRCFPCAYHPFHVHLHLRLPACGDETSLSSRVSAATDRLHCPFTYYSACLPFHCWPCEPAAPICNLTLCFPSSQSSQNIIFLPSALPQSWSTTQTTPVTMQAAPTRKRRRSTDDDADGQSEPVDKVYEIDTLKTAISDSLTPNPESTSHPGVFELGLPMATSGFLQQSISVLPLSAVQI